MLMAALLAPPTIDVRSMVAPDWQSVVHEIEKYHQANPDRPIVAFGFDPISHGHESPTMAELDALVSSVPLLLANFSAHSAVGNSKAFELAGITSATPDPAGGEFKRDETGELTGEAFEATAVAQLGLPILLAAGGDQAQKLRSQYAVMSEAGYTMVGELLTQGPGDAAVLDAMGRTPNCPVRIRSYEGTNDSRRTEMALANGDEMHRQVGLKLWVDGAVWLGNIDVSQPFLDTPATRNLGLAPDFCGSANYTKEQLYEILNAYVASGFQMACHVHGDHGIDTILDVYEQVLTEQNLIDTDHRWRLEHCGNMDGAQFARATSLGVHCSLFMHHLYYWGSVLMNDLLGPERGSHWMRCRSAIDAGQRISLHNDGYVTPPDPIGNVWTAVNRIDRASGQVLGADECITVDEGLAAVTINAAWQLKSDHEVGSIEVGKFADFVELDNDPYSVEPARLKDEVHVVGTWLAGQPTRPAQFIET